MRRNVNIHIGTEYCSEDNEFVTVNATVYGHWGVTRQLEYAWDRNLEKWVPESKKRLRFNVTHIPSGLAAKQGLSNAKAHALAKELALHPILCRADLKEAVVDKATTGRDRYDIGKAWLAIRDKY